MKVNIFVVTFFVERWLFFNCNDVIIETFSRQVELGESKCIGSLSDKNSMIYNSIQRKLQTTISEENRSFATRVDIIDIKPSQENKQNKK